jgi:hypothetical protein
VTAVTPPTSSSSSEGGSDLDEYPEAGRKELKKLLETEAGKRIYEKLKAKANADDGPGASRKVWENKDFRVDPRGIVTTREAFATGSFR